MAEGQAWRQGELGKDYGLVFAAGHSAPYPQNGFLYTSKDGVHITKVGAQRIYANLFFDGARLNVCKEVYLDQIHTSGARVTWQGFGLPFIQAMTVKDNKIFVVFGKSGYHGGSVEKVVRKGKKGMLEEGHLITEKKVQGLNYARNLAFLGDTLLHTDGRGLVDSLENKVIHSVGGGARALTVLGANCWFGGESGIIFGYDGKNASEVAALNSPISVLHAVQTPNGVVLYIASEKKKTGIERMNLQTQESETILDVPEVLDVESIQTVPIQFIEQVLEKDAERRVRCEEGYWRHSVAEFF